MGKYNGAVITAAGQNLIAQAITESKMVTFTTAQVSSHAYPSSTDFEALTALTDVEKTVDINYAGVYSDTVVQVSARFDNDGVETAYLINTLGFFAQLGTDTPILFAVSTAVTPDQMPVFDADNPSAFIYNMQITVQNANSINVSINPAGTVTVDQLNTVVSTINANIGDLSDLTTEDKTSLVNAINEVDANADAAQASANNAQQMIAPIQSNLTASQNYAIGEQFIYNGLLYKATTAIAQGGAITINGNCTLSPLIAKQLSDLSLIKSATIPNTDNTILARRYGRLILILIDGLIENSSTQFNVDLGAEFTALFLARGVIATFSGNYTGRVTIADSGHSMVVDIPSGGLGQRFYGQLEYISKE